MSTQTDKLPVDQPLCVGGRTLTSRLIVGTGKYKDLGRAGDYRRGST